MPAPYPMLRDLAGALLACVLLGTPLLAGAVPWARQEAAALPINPAIADLGPVQTDPARRWTIAIYLAGDNDLEPAAMADIQEIAAALPAAGVEVVVLLDRAKGYLDEEGGWSDADIFRYVPEQGALVPVKGLGEVNTGDGRTLASFFSGVFHTWPAQQHAAFIWNHGGGWSGIAVDEDGGNDQPGKDQLDLQEIRAGLQAAVAQTGRPLDLLAFDACLMGQLEVALQVEDLARYMVASEEVVPGLGYPYDRILPLFADRRLDPRLMAVGMVQAFTASYEEQHMPVTTLAALELQQTAAVAQALDAFSAQAEAGLQQHWPAVARALFYAESYQPRAERLSEARQPSFDLLDLARRISDGYGTPAMQQAYARLEAAVQALVIYSANGELRNLSHGLAIYGVRTPQQWSDEYAGTPLAGSRWPQLLLRVQQLAAQNAGDPVQFTDMQLLTSDNRRAVRPFNGDRLKFTVDGRSIVQMLQIDSLRNDEDNGWLRLRRAWVPDLGWMARVNQGNADISDLFMPQFRDGRTELAVELTGLQFVISNGGEDAARATLDTTDLRPNAPIVAQALWYPAGSGRSVPVEVHFDRIWWNVVEVRELSSSPQVAPRSVQPAKEDEFAFVLESLGDDGRESQVLAPRLSWRDGLTLVMDSDAPDRYRTSLVAITMDGRHALASAEYRVEENPELTRWRSSWSQFDPAAFKGRWSRELLTGDGQWQDLDSPSSLSPLPQLGNGAFKAVSEFGPAGARQSIEQIWLLETRGLPSLRIVTRQEDKADLVWYGPARFGHEDGRPWLAMKAVQVGGVVWRWKQGLYDMLSIPQR